MAAGPARSGGRWAGRGFTPRLTPWRPDLTLCPVRVQLTRHARAMLAERRIEVAWVERTVGVPEAIEQDRVNLRLDHCLRRIPEYGNRVWRVVADQLKIRHWS